MKQRFLLHAISHTFLVVNITKIGLDTEILPETGLELTLPAARFRSWQHVERYLAPWGQMRNSLKEYQSLLRRLAWPS